MDPYLFKIQIEDIPPILDYMTWPLQHRRAESFLRIVFPSQPLKNQASWKMAYSNCQSHLFSGSIDGLASGIMQKKVVGGLEHLFPYVGNKKIQSD